MTQTNDTKLLYKKGVAKREKERRGRGGEKMAGSPDQSGEILF
jgi:hypothetical protein